VACESHKYDLPTLAAAERTEETAHNCLLEVSMTKVRLLTLAYVRQIFLVKAQASACQLATAVHIPNKRGGRSWLVC
jgi:hypothetical protein